MALFGFAKEMPPASPRSTVRCQRHSQRSASAELYSASALEPLVPVP